MRDILPELRVGRPGGRRRRRRASVLPGEPSHLHAASPSVYGGAVRGRALSPVRGTSMGKIAVGIVGVGNCASSLLQGIEFYRTADFDAAKHHVGLMHYDVCGYRPRDIEVVCAFD